MAASINSNSGISYLFTGLFLGVAFLTALLSNTLLFFLPVAFLFGYAGWQSPGLIFFLLLISLPFSFEHEFAFGWSTDIPDEFLMLFVSFLVVGILAYQPKRISVILHHSLVQLVILWFMWMTISALFSSYHVISLKFLLAKGWYACAFLLAPVILCNNRSSIRTCAVCFLIALFAVVFIIMIRHGWEGFRFASVNDAVAPFFRNHVNYSAMLVCSLPILMGVYAYGNRKTKQWIVFAIVLVALPALFLAYSRGAWLALGAGIVSWWLLKRKLLLATFVVGLVLAITALGWLFQDKRYLGYAHDFNTTIFHSDFREHLQATYQMKDISAAERFYRWIAAVKMTTENPVTGSGPGTFYNNYKSYTVPAFKTWVSGNPERSTAHNYFLLTAAEQGIPGVLLLIILLGACIWYAQRLYHKCTDLLYRTMSAVAGTMLVMIIVLNLLSDLVETDKVGSLFFLSIAMLIIAGINQSNTSDTSTNVKRIS